MCRKLLSRLNPFRAGRCLSTEWYFSGTLRTGGLNPFRAGRCLSTVGSHCMRSLICLNPFRTGRCLSTYVKIVNVPMLERLNPFRTGRCLSTNSGNHLTISLDRSQSLSNRAMSFDGWSRLNHWTNSVSIPFEQGDVFRLSVSFKFRYLLQRLNPFRAGRCLSTHAFG